MNAAHHPYHVKMIRFTAPNAYHVVNSSTKVTHTMWGTVEEAKRVCRDLNLAIRRERLAKAKSK